MDTTNKMRAKRQKKRNVSEGLAYIKATFNNTIVTITTLNGDVITFAGAGNCGFKGARKKTPYAAQLVADKVAKSAQEKVGLKRLAAVYISGAGGGRDSAIRALKNAGLEIGRLEDTTPVPHNGCRPRKKRRI